MSENSPTPAPNKTPAAGGVPENGAGTMALVFGILSFFCIPFIGAILAIVFGRIGMKKAAEGRATNGGPAKIGFILGLISIIFSIIGGIIWIVVIANAAKNGTLVTTACGFGDNPPC